MIKIMATRKVAIICIHIYLLLIYLFYRFVCDSSF
jgi:hypothetical protein